MASSLNPAASRTLSSRQFDVSYELFIKGKKEDFVHVDTVCIELIQQVGLNQAKALAQLADQAWVAHYTRTKEYRNLPPEFTQVVGGPARVKALVEHAHKFPRRQPSGLMAASASAPEMAHALRGAPAAAAAAATEPKPIVPVQRRPFAVVSSNALNIPQAQRGAPAAAAAAAACAQKLIVPVPRSTRTPEEPRKIRAGLPSAAASASAPNMAHVLRKAPAAAAAASAPNLILLPGIPGLGYQHHPSQRCVHLLEIPEEDRSASPNFGTAQPYHKDPREAQSSPLRSRASPDARFDSPPGSASSGSPPSMKLAWGK